MPGPVFREGVTVELRTIETEDADVLQELVNDPRVRASIAGVDPVNGPEERAWIESIDEASGVRLLICVEGEAVGTIDLHDPNEVWGVAEIGYLLDPAAWNNGYATDAVAEICAYAFHERRLHKVVATTYATNHASRRVLEKVGFTEEGVLREEAFVDGERVDRLRYGLLVDEYDPEAIDR